MAIANLDRWFALCHSAGTAVGVEKAYNTLTSLYCSAVRQYHNLEHIEHCLNEYDQIKGTAHYKLALEYAIWYHDAIYDSTRFDNEEKSAEFASAALTSMEAPDKLVRQVGEIIMLTKHNCVPDNVDGAIMVDVDLSILGHPEEKYTQYESKVRQEYSWVAEEAFWSERSKFLSGLLKRDHIFYTAQCQKKYEAIARENISRSLAQRGMQNRT